VRIGMPTWLAAGSWTALFLLVHVAAPLGLSLLSVREGWVSGRPGAWNLLALLIVIPGIATTAWLVVQHYVASPQSFLELTRTQTMLTRGPYAYSRNPMYVLELAFWVGWSLFYGSVTVLIGVLLWWLAFSLVIVPREERVLEQQFGEAYRAYKARVPRWLGLPRV
jgi:protein-S-isoprenylcysteine O-methyltransferase Ste14